MVKDAASSEWMCSLHLSLLDRFGLLCSVDSHITRVGQFSIIPSKHSTKTPKGKQYQAMLASLSSILISIALTSTVAARVMPNSPIVPNQQPLQEPIQEQETLEDLTTTLHTTITSYISIRTVTASRTRYTSDSTTNIPEAVQTWYAAQKTAGCDRTACASCRVWYGCGGLFETPW